MDESITSVFRVQNFINVAPSYHINGGKKFLRNVPTFLADYMTSAGWYIRDALDVSGGALIRPRQSPSKSFQFAVGHSSRNSTLYGLGSQSAENYLQNYTASHSRITKFERWASPSISTSHYCGWLQASETYQVRSLHDVIRRGARYVTSLVLST